MKINSMNLLGVTTHESILRRPQRIGHLDQTTSENALNYQLTFDRLRVPLSNPLTKGKEDERESCINNELEPV